jgi:hypothetical protein
MTHILKLNLTELQRAELKTEFDQLETVEKQLEFWNEKLKFDFSFFDQFEMYDIQDFWIRPQNENEFELVNNRNLNYFKATQVFYHPNNRTFDIEDLKQNFFSQVENVSSKVNFINEELRRLDSLINQKEIQVRQNPISSSRFFIATYKQYIEKSIVQIWNQSIVETNNLVESYKGLTAAKYKEFLEDYKSPRKPVEKKIYSHAVQLLILDYLGYNKDLVNTKKAKLFAPILNRDIETTRQMLSDFKELKTNKNLELILSLFTEIGLDEQIQLVEKDIDRLNKKK